MTTPAAGIVAALLLAGCTASPRAPESSCMQRTLDSLDLDGMTDLRRHCMASGTIAVRCGSASAWIAGHAKEIADAFGPGDASSADLAANRAGRDCARAAAGEQGLAACCSGAGY